MEVLESPMNSPQEASNEVIDQIDLKRRAMRKALKAHGRYENSARMSDSEADSPSAAGATTIQWEELTRSGQVYSPRFDHAVTRKRNKIYLFGGDTGMAYSKSRFLADLYEYDLELQKWRLVRVKSTSPCARAGHIMIAHRKRLHIFGGVGAGGKLDDFWSYDPDINVWGRRALNGSVTPPARSHHSALLHNDNLIVFGGSSYEGNGVVWNLDLLSKTWRILCTSDGIFGGKKIPLSKAIRPEHIESFKQIAAKSSASSEFPRARAMHRAAIFGDSMYVFGGVMIDSIARSDEITNELWCFDLNTKTWTNMTPAGQTHWPRARAGHATTIVGHRWIIHGGRTHQDTTLSSHMTNMSHLGHQDINDESPSSLPDPAIPFTQQQQSGSVVVFESHSTPPSSLPLPFEQQIPLGDVWSFNFLTRHWELLCDRPGSSSNGPTVSPTDDDHKKASTMYFQPSRWGHDLLMCKKTAANPTTGDDAIKQTTKSQRFIVVTGGVSLAPLPLY